MKARFRYRIYPNRLQRLMLAKTFGCARVVYNDAIRLRQDLYQQGEKVSDTELQKRVITQAKLTVEREWLSEVASVPLVQSLQDAHLAFRNFFKSLKGERKGRKIGFPKFKKKHSTQSIRFTTNGFSIKPNSVYLAKIGCVRVKWSRELPSDPSSVTIIKDAADRYFASFVCEVDPIALNAINDGVGIDLGLTTFATLSTGEKVLSPKPLAKSLKRLRRAQKSLSRKIKGSKRRYLARRKVARIHARIKDQRTDFLHKLSTRIVRENQAIVLEDLNVSGMVKNRKLARAISDAGWYSFRQMIEGKSIRYGRDFQVISRWEPTSQRCSSCGQLGGKKPLDVREWVCMHCGAIHDRDVNAAINIKVAGGQSETQNGRGGQRKSSSLVAADEASTRGLVEQLRLFA
ncbi:IS200/IS605 family element transposase accessory protein TnpB [Limnothrix sp. FACHB-881]|uniref:RNA-guided endonuclease InsQ/TnpB family protein n=1 Tax=Limnothrix sp. FACHB-881 TaxID=2692819 RepID=UPI00168866BD|nr:RNA-guided endonuclease TnpB family protein [Limnothrix sp. FACHB-881]MBD2636616.1 IS200/IS605 family element transposase accessory protein TnpB [Limnothrix sp. FACHB-881]